jgi:ATP-dependent protease ClpP protease subunit
MTADQAKEYGIIDEVIATRKLADMRATGNGQA